MRARVTVVVGAVGGVGASTLAALLARRRVAAGRTVVLVDLDVGRGGVDVLLGLEQASGVRWTDLAGVRGTLGPEDLDGLLPSWRGVDVLSAGRVPAGGVRAAGGMSRGADGALGGADAVAAVCGALASARRDVVVDLPAAVVRTGGDEPPWRELLGVGRVLVVTGQDVLGVAGGVAALAALGTACDAGVLRRRRGARVAPGEAAAALGVPIAGLLPADGAVASSTDRGLGPIPAAWSALARAVRRIDGGDS